ncbi:MAG TPA: sugar transporter, partial [Sphingopyxis sp.]|nr:sugar transporter [Sphingopyxis sp.]
PQNAQPGHVPADTLRNLASIYIAVLSIATVIAIICLAYYPISRSRHLENIRQLGAAAAE